MVKYRVCRKVTHLLCKVHTLIHTLRTELRCYVASNTKVLVCTYIREHLMAALYVCINGKQNPDVKSQFNPQYLCTSCIISLATIFTKRMMEYANWLGTLRAMPFTFTSSASINQLITSPGNGVRLCPSPGFIYFPLI